MYSVSCEFFHLLVVMSLTSTAVLDDLPKSHLLDSPSCWGYEPGCTTKHRISQPYCKEGATGWPGEVDPLELFYKQADFGFVRDRLKEMVTICEPLDDKNKMRSELQCSKDLQFCRGKNIMLDFSSIAGRINRENLKYRMDIFEPGDVLLTGCKLDKELLDKNLELMSPLQSWAPEMRNLKVSKEYTDDQCDVIIDTPTYVMKLDATVNMYHHFCDFFNLYLSIHVNSSLSSMDMSSWDVGKQVLLLENIPYSSSFHPTWSAFTSLPLMDLNNVAGKKVCLKEAMFPLLPRMLYGLFYNTPLVSDCYNSGLFRSFSDFILHRLKIPQHGLLADQRVRVTIISRDTRHRKVINEGDLVKALDQTGLYRVTLARYTSHVPFSSQLTITHNTDILVGMHGAGLTHLLFLPDWAEVFELFSCDDPACYKDLARMRGVGYNTHDWGDRMTMIEVTGGYTGPAHKKFVNYEFDSEEFLRVMNHIRKKLLNKKMFRKRKNDATSHEEL